MVLVSVIFVNYNGKEHIKTCLSSLYKQTMKDFEVVLVDNRSTDGSVEFVRKNFPKVRVVENKENVGFAEGNNIGVRHARGKYVFILNLDTELDRHCLREMADCAKRNAGAAVCAKILFFEKRSRINTTGVAFNYLGFGWCDNLGRNDKDFQEETELTFPSGAAFMIDKRIFSELGGFDRSYFFYYEDSDLGWRMRLRGYKTVLAPKAKVYHKYFFGRHPRKLYYAERNRIITVLKNYQARTLLLIAPPFLLTELGVIFYFLISGSVRSKLGGYWWILKNMGSIIESRRKVQRTRNVGDREIVKHFFTTIEFRQISSPVIEHVLNPVLNAYWKLIRRFV
ncbi:MAG: glycosyltransferase family 2 protein [Candidatus Aenigmatarchaeota archaeon]